MYSSLHDFIVKEYLVRCSN